MSPISINVFRHIPTSLELNPSKIEFTTQPTSQSNDAGENVTFTGIAEVLVGSGSISYQWYEDGVELVDGGRISGSSTNSLTISNLESPADKNRSFFLRATFTPSGGSANATNNPLDSNTVSISNVWPFLSPILQPPFSETVLVNEPTTISVLASVSDTSYGSIKYQWTSSVSGILQESASSDLTFTPTVVREETISVIAYVDTDGGRKSAEFNDLGLTVREPKNILGIEALSSVGSGIEKLEFDVLEGSSFELDQDTFSSNLSVIQFYSVESSFELELEMYGASGRNYYEGGIRGGDFEGALASIFGVTRRGRGGKSIIRFTVDKNVEYTILGINPQSGLFLYRGSNLIAVVGSGGDIGAGDFGDIYGGDGGGVNLPGTKSRRSGIAIETDFIEPGELTLQGRWGDGRAPADILPEEFLSAAVDPDPEGGRTISCSKGPYWISQGISACSLNSAGRIKYRDKNGLEVGASASLIRGFKPGYTVTATGDKLRIDGVDIFGGDGSRGGGVTIDGNIANRQGGDGGSGYTNGEVNIITTETGKSDGNSKIIFRLPTEVIPEPEPEPIPEPVPVPDPPVSVSGGLEFTHNGKKFHWFISSSPISISGRGRIHYAAGGGGGAGGTWAKFGSPTAGGGGAGGYGTGHIDMTPESAFDGTVNIGAGGLNGILGNGGVPSNNSPTDFRYLNEAYVGQNGGDTTIPGLGLTFGGGGGGGCQITNGRLPAQDYLNGNAKSATLGSGGGAGGVQTTSATGGPQGNPGGATNYVAPSPLVDGEVQDASSGVTFRSSGGGGGGAGAAGFPGAQTAPLHSPDNTQGAKGIGVELPSEVMAMYPTIPNGSIIKNNPAGNFFGYGRNLICEGGWGDKANVVSIQPTTSSKDQGAGGGGHGGASPSWYDDMSEKKGRFVGDGSTSGGFGRDGFFIVWYDIE